MSSFEWNDQTSTSTTTTTNTVLSSKKLTVQRYIFKVFLIKNNETSLKIFNWQMND